MSTGITKYLCVSIPHGGISIPPEISLDSLSEDYQDMMNAHVDHGTRSLYDFTDLLDNRQVVFRYSPVLINVNRHPDVLDDCVPVIVEGVRVYKEHSEPDVSLRKKLAATYHRNFHKRLSRLTEKGLILDGHSTYWGHKDASDHVITEDIIVSNWQHSKYELEKGFHTAPQHYLDIYVENLQKRLPGLTITANTKYSSTYGHVMARHGWDGVGDRGGRSPLLLQETSEDLYMTHGVPLYREVEHLRRIFAEAIEDTLKRVCDFEK
jgi:hypothetical protein